MMTPGDLAAQAIADSILGGGEFAQVQQVASASDLVVIWESWRAAGYPPGLIARAMHMASRWMAGLTGLVAPPPLTPPTGLILPFPRRAA